ncbi:MAG: tRNA (guanosine(37)-N1)-methyltransferase TrmD [Calditrichia bacterium]
MRIDVITAFPKIIQAPLDESILKQAKKRTSLKINIWDLREFASDKHRTLDDTPYGGGPGLIMKAGPIFAAFEHILSETVGETQPRIIFPTPQGKLFTQGYAGDLSREGHLIILCGHYKAVDQRVIDTWVTDEISIGDFVLSGGEIPALLIVDAVVRLVPGAIGDAASAKSDSFEGFLLDCPYYTRPEEFRGQKVPGVLLSGDHRKIDEWRLKQKIERTKERRPDLYRKYLSAEKNEIKK